MATITTNAGVILRTENKTNLSHVGLRNQTMIYKGLRSLNKVDVLQMRTNAKATGRTSAKRNEPNHASDRPSAAITCGSGMNLVFVGAEVGPWSKTGGLGDVLGGLPPSMAVSSSSFSSFLFLALQMQKTNTSWEFLQDELYLIYFYD